MMLLPRDRPSTSMDAHVYISGILAQIRLEYLELDWIADIHALIYSRQ